MKRLMIKALYGFCGWMTLAACASESNRMVEPVAVESHGQTFTGTKHDLALGRFDNRSSYGQGVFSENSTRLSGQARTILQTHLQQTGRFRVMDRSNMDEVAGEARLAGTTQNIRAARYLVTGDVTEFGRKTVGDRQLFGILGHGKSQIAYAKVMLNVVDVTTSSVVHSVAAGGEYELSTREVIGFGGQAGYDSTLNGKVLDLAIREAVNTLIRDLEARRWSI